MQIVVKTKEVYGVRNIYPVCDTAKLFADVAGTKTLTPSVINLLKKAGYSIEVIAPEVTL